MKVFSTAAVILFALVTNFRQGALDPPQKGVDIRAAGKVLDDAALEEILTGLGYEPKKLSKGFLVTVKKDEWTYYIQFVLSGDTTRLGMNANLGSVDNPDTVTAKEWMDLLAQNNVIDPSSFNFDKTQKKLYLHRVLDNRAITPAYIRVQIENFYTNIHDTSDYWKFVK